MSDGPLFEHAVERPSSRYFRCHPVRNAQLKAGFFTPLPSTGSVAEPCRAQSALTGGVPS